MTLPERLVELHRALAARRIRHAFGGAIALAYWTLDPRGTNDIDVNVFVPAERAERAAKRMVKLARQRAAQAMRRNQRRIATSEPAPSTAGAPRHDGDVPTTH